MTHLVTESLEYLPQSDTFVRTMIIGGALMFAYQLFLRAVFVSVTTNGDLMAGPFVGSSPVVVSGLTAFGLVSFLALAGFYVRIAACVVAGEKTPPGFTDSRRLVLNGTLFCATLLAIVGAAVVVQVALFTLVVASVTVLDVVVGITFIETIIFALSVFFAVLTAISIVYPQPSIWILIARFRLGNGSSRRYLRFVVSRGFVSELGSILLSRRYASSWVALVVVSILQGAATIEGSGLFGVSRPVDLLVRLNTEFVSALVSFYASVAVVYIYATRFRDRDQSHQTTFREFESPPDSG